ncbi:MAG: AAA family ATPase [Actinomycetota bacterium]|nr:AAA family ATPase [Actinomycetota bacterium]
MPKFDVLVWRDHSRYWTAQWVEDDAKYAAIARTPDLAVQQVRDYLRWRTQRDEYFRGEAWVLQDLEILSVRVDVRPEYRENDRTYPCDEDVRVHVPVIRAQRDGGLLVCLIPTLSIGFDYYNEKSFRSLVVYAVQSELKGCTPAEIAMHMPPPELRIEQVHVSKQKIKSHGFSPDAASVALQAVADPLTMRGRGSYRRFTQCWERDSEVKELMRRLGSERVNTVLLGESGCGKTTVLVQAAWRLKHSDGELSGAGDCRFWRTSAARLIAGMQYLGEWQERCEEIIADLADIDGVLCVDNLLDLVRVGGQSPNASLAAFFVPYLQRGELRIVGEATPPELDACRRQLPAFADALQILRIESFEKARAITVLHRIAESPQQDLRAKLQPGVVEAVYRLFHRFQPYHVFPGRATAFLVNLLDGARQTKKPEVTVGDAIDAFVRETGLPELMLRDEVAMSHADVVAELRHSVIGQDSACEKAADFILAFKAGLNDPGRPLGVLLFCGPTGVGKTELAKAISGFLFGHGKESDRLVRLDMSEFAGHSGADRLLTDTAGQPSQLIRRLRKQPFSVLLFDEIEKASSSVLDMLLGVFDEGRLTDPYGRVTTFKSAVIIMTSNVGADHSEAFGFAKEPSTSFVREVGAFFRPEFVNRIDAIVSFQPLAGDTLRRIVNKELKSIAQREGLKQRRITLQWTDEVVDLLVRVGYDQRYGARPLQRTIERLVVTPLSRHLLSQTQSGHTAVKVVVVSDQLVIVS